ncbi:MAG TPA: DedA family protein [Noviherbaspirillum sp.]|nr:DedA family protein [Noviherbaspirillum sp.]
MFDFIVDLVTHSGYLGVFLLMAAENIFPPIPSELIMPLAGFVAARGDMNMVMVIIAGTLGSVLGTMPWYYAGKLLGADRLRRLSDRYGKWLTVSPQDVDQALLTFARYGRAAIFFGRLVPAIRTLISIPAGIARMPLANYLAYTTVGSLIWTALLACAGFVLESQYARVADYVDPVSKLVVLAVIATYVYRLVTQHFQRKGQQR